MDATAAAGEPLRGLHRCARVQIPTADASGVRPAWRADVLVLDVYDGDETPESFSSPAVLAPLAARVGSAGLLAIDVADDADHRRLKRLRRVVRQLLPVTAAVGATAFIEGRTSGHAILLASRSALARGVAARLLLPGPHPVSAAPNGDVVVVEVAVEVDP
ncbi:hypothetical protein SAMN06295924_103333 [Rathayibacter rathayi NCPPB 2980 = VKM Ac-1601]|nr:hypothetical protein FB469_2953 [Rathayibacter rathayi]SOE04281.1 hypothetical protein SAMN06295924_103333 [Rathayibacter rathayi NCPPB 2980 = VKM Ac-1601]